MGRQLRYAVCAVAVATLAAVGCTGGEDPPSPSWSPSSSITSTAAASGAPSTASTPTTTSRTTPAVDIPKAARAHTAQGAEAFVTFFVEQSNVASTKADPTVLPPLVDAGCKSCQALQDQVVELNAKGHRYASAPVTIGAVDAIDGGANGQQFVRLHMVQNEVDVLDSAGNVISTDPHAQLARTASLVWIGNRWFLYGIA